MKKRLKNYFVPHEQNEHKPHFLREKSVFVLGFVIALLFVLSLFQYSLLVNTNLASIISAVLVDLTNSEREATNLNSLAVNPLLAEAAQKKANDMAAKSYFSHDSPDGLTPWHWFGEVGYDFDYAGENLAINFSDSKNAKEAWMNSVSHRANILNSKFTEIGIATAKGEYKGKETIFVVQMFGKPKSVLVVNTEPTIVTEEPTTETLVLAKDKINQEVLVKGETTNYASLSEEIVASPQKTLMYLYISLGALVLFGLFLLIFVNIRVQHPRHILYGVLLTLLMLVLAYVNQFIIFPDLLIK